MANWIRFRQHLLQAFSFVAGLVFLSSPLQADDPLRAKIAQMFIVGFPGSTIPESLLVDLCVRNLGGVIVSGANGNLNNPTQIRQLTDALRANALTAPFIAVDQEGGRVARLNATNGFASTATAFQLGTTYASVDSTRAQAALMATWLNTCGLNLNFAPVIDVNVNPLSPAIGKLERSFSNIPATVSAHAQAFTDAFHEQHIMTATKHFPGHGSAANDSHLTLPDITNTWSSDELTPYRDLIRTNSIDLVMVGHLYNAHIDSTYPSSLSRSTITGLLRDSLHYTGVVITDAMGMGAITNNYGFWDAAELSINAGTDILLYTSSIADGGSLVRQMVDSIESRVQRGRISVARINESFTRITTLKSRYLQTGIAAVRAPASDVPAVFALGNYPNPFNPSTIVRLDIPYRSMVRVEIYDILGRLVEILRSDELNSGVVEMRWEPQGSSGVYFCRVEARPSGGGPAFRAIQKMLFVK